MMEGKKRGRWVGVSKSLVRPESALALYLSYESIQHGIDWILTGTIGSTTPYIHLLLVSATVLLALWCSLRKTMTISADFGIVFFALCLLYGISMLNEGNLRVILDQNLLMHTLLEGMLGYLLFTLCNDYASLWKYLLIASWAIIILFLGAFLTYDVGSTTSYRPFSAGLILCGTVFCINWLYNSCHGYVIPFSICVVLIATCGRRSSLVVLAVCFVMLAVMKREWFYLILGLIAFALIILLWRSLLEAMLGFIQGFGVRPRILMRILHGTATDDSHRFEQWSYALSITNDNLSHLFFGRGIAGERKEMLSHFIHMEQYGYPHNIAVELIAQYGVIVGTIIFISLFLILPMKLFSINKLDMSIIPLFIFLYSNVSALLFQESYLQNKYFYIYLALLALSFKNLGIGISNEYRNLNLS